MVATARARICELSTEEAIALIDDPDVVIVDIRDIRERQRSGAIPAPFTPRADDRILGRPRQPYHKPVFAQPGKRYVFHCASGWRSALTVATLQDMGFAASHLRDGFTDWVNQGGPVEPVPAKD
ncbi:rhodanese-like domain-containing protein [Salipiger sp.]|uniref:rhodanese-like domain-containing protein n=1 Tax=Salipiger sp. TaxID=2078585 RepID=UPI003A970985